LSLLLDRYWAGLAESEIAVALPDAYPISEGYVMVFPGSPKTVLPMQLSIQARGVAVVRIPIFAAIEGFEVVCVEQMPPSTSVPTERDDTKS
jgi:hypothetical protein